MDKVARLKPALSMKRAKAFRVRALKYSAALKRASVKFERTGATPVGIGAKCPRRLRSWLMDSSLKALPNNETRGHMPSDLARYFFATVFGQVAGTSPKASHYPADLAPDHRNWNTGKFADRFRVQLWNQPSTTVTCHISKDGHYFIHPDPMQCRSLTVREAARLQTFPDNYFFKGNRTQQYVQVGNAVPPYLARQIAEALHSLFIQVKSLRSPRPVKTRTRQSTSLMKYSAIASSK
jgi:DNA (cytosine-5)-methyltransferase 1